MLEPGACRPIGDLLAEPLIAMLDRCARHPVYRALNEGRPEKMGEYLGIGEDVGIRRSRELGNHCLWCDEFFTARAGAAASRRQDRAGRRGPRTALSRRWRQSSFLLALVAVLAPALRKADQPSPHRRRLTGEI